MVIREVAVKCYNVTYFILSKDGKVEEIVKANQLLNDVAASYLDDSVSNPDSIDELPELKFYYEGAEVSNTTRIF